MTLKERCQTSEIKLAQVSTALLDLRPGMLDDCESYLQEVVDLLAGEAPSADHKPDLLRLRYKARLLGLQVQHAANLCQGWAQLGLSDGYTEEGRPALSPTEPRSSYEV